MENPTGREIDVVVHLMDRQVVDPDDRMVCNVDDVELTVPEDGGPPYVTAILAGPGALLPRLGRPVPVPPRRIDFGVVDEVGSRVRVSRKRDDLSVNRTEAWVRDHVVGKIPGASGAGE